MPSYRPPLRELSCGLASPKMCEWACADCGSGNRNGVQCGHGGGKGGDGEGMPRNRARRQGGRGG